MKADAICHFPNGQTKVVTVDLDYIEDEDDLFYQAANECGAAQDADEEILHLSRGQEFWIENKDEILNMC